MKSVDTIKIKKIQAYLNNFFWLFLTYFLAPYFYFLIFFRGRDSSGVKKILIIQTAKIGDLVCTTPIFREIKEKFPSCFLAVLVNSKTEDILKNNPRVDKIILLDDYTKIKDKFKLFGKLRKEKYDLAISVSPGSFNSIIGFWSLIPRRITTTYRYSGEIVGLLSIFNNYRLEYKRHTPLMRHYLNLLKLIGIEESSEQRELFIQAAEERKASDFLKAQNLNSHDLLIGISCTAGVKLREWEPSCFAGLADKLIKEKNAKIIFIGSADDRTLVEKIQKMMQNNSVNAAGFFKLSELPALLKKLKLFISVDTGPLYMADTLGVPVVDIAGPVDVKELYPINDQCKIIQKIIYCVPCSYMFYAPRFCREGHLRCLKEITPQDVFDAAVSLINEPR